MSKLFVCWIKHLIFLCAVIIVIAVSGCASGSKTGEGAAKGAAAGAISGAVGGMVSALVFGGDPMDRAARGAVYGGTTGAVAGAIAGSQADAQQKDQTEKELKKLREDIGDDAYDGLAALAECKHSKSIQQAVKAQKGENPNYVLAGLWLEVLSYADQKDEAKARDMFPTLIEKDWNIKTEAQAEESMRKGLSALMDIREEFDMPRVCSG